jgi:hypothetical protein
MSCSIALDGARNFQLDLLLQPSKAKGRLQMNPSNAEKLDDASWHYGGDFPAGLPDDNGGTHIGMFLGWAIDNNLINKQTIADFPEVIDVFKQKKMTGREILFKYFDGKLSGGDLAPAASKFAANYYAKDFLKAYSAILPSPKGVYGVTDSWHNFDKVNSMLKLSFRQWTADHE